MTVSDLSPDRTTKITRALGDAMGRSRAAQASKFVWPPPPYYEFAGETRPGGETCLLTFTDGERATGVLQAFLPEFEVLKFLPDKAKSAVTIAFSALLGAHLLNSVAVRRQNIPTGGAGEFFAPSDRQPFFVQLVNGNTMEGDTVGHVRSEERRVGKECRL